MRAAILAAAAALAVAAPAQAQDYPTRPVTVVVPFPAGGPTDVVGRIVAAAMAGELGQQVLVQNVGGAGGTLGSGQVAQAAPDGYTLLLHSIGLSTAPTLYRKLAFDPLEDFAPIGLITSVPMAIVARPDFEPDDAAAFAQYLNSHGGDITIAHAGLGTSSYLCGMLLQEEVAAKFVEVPYQGTGPALADVMGGQVDLLCDQTTSTTKQIQGGEVKAYVLTTADRLGTLPDLPTAKESGLEGLEISIWHGLYAPAGTDPAIIARLETALKVAVQDETVGARFRELGTEPVSPEEASPAALAKTLAEQVAFWKPIIEARGVFAD